MAANLDDLAKELEADLATFASDMYATQQRLPEKGFRVDTIADYAVSGAGSLVSHQTNSAMTAIPSVLRANTSRLTPSKSW